MNLWVHQQALGDLVLALPTLRALARVGPTTVVAPYSHAVFAASRADGVSGSTGHVSAMGIESFEWTRMHVEGGPTSLSPRVSDLFASAERVVSFVSDGHDAWSRNAQRWMPGARLHAVAARPPNGWDAHVSDWHREQLASAGLDWSDVMPATHSGLQRAATAGRAVVMHPGSGGRDKCWPMASWLALSEALRARGRHVCLVFGEAERERFMGDVWETLVRSASESVFCRTLEDLCGVLRKVSVYVGNDAGPTHVSAELGVRTLVLFGPTSPAVWAPRSGLGASGASLVSVVSPTAPSPMSWLGVERVLSELDRLEGGSQL